MFRVLRNRQVLGSQSFRSLGFSVFKGLRALGVLGFGVFRV